MRRMWVVSSPRCGGQRGSSSERRLLARALRRARRAPGRASWYSRRRYFVNIDARYGLRASIGALPAHLAVAEIFGHERAPSPTPVPIGWAVSTEQRWHAKFRDRTPSPLPRDLERPIST